MFAAWHTHCTVGGVRAGQRDARSHLTRNEEMIMKMITALTTGFFLLALTASPALAGGHSKGHVSVSIVGHRGIFGVSISNRHCDNDDYDDDYYGDDDDHGYRRGDDDDRDRGIRVAVHSKRSQHKSDHGDDD